MAALLAAYAAMAYTAALVKGVSFDEGLQLAVGYNLWLNHDYRMEGANGDFVKRWATLPFLLSRPAFVPRGDPAWQNPRPYELGRRFLFELGNRPESLLRQARAMMVLLGVVAGAFVYLCARELSGWRGGLLALGLFAFSPHLLAFGGIASTDLPAALLLLASTWFIWRLLHRLTAASLLGSLATFGLLLLAKMTALAIFPITAVLLAVRFMAGGPLDLAWRRHRWRITSRRTQAAVFAALVVAHAVAGWSAIWAHYGFRYTASPDPSDPRIVLRQQTGRDPVPEGIESVVHWARDTHFLPEGFCEGVDWLLGDDDLRPAFMDGRWTRGGWATFFPYAIWVKTGPALFLLLAIAALAWVAARRRGHAVAAECWPPGAVGWLYAATPYLALIGVYLALAMTEDLNLGHRHVLPIYPAWFVLVGAAALVPGRWMQWSVGVLLAWHAAESLAVRPDYLAYFAPQAGGPAAGYRHLVDSSLDWGMDLPGLKRWLERNDPRGQQPVFLGYFGTDSPGAEGIVARRLPGFPDRRRPQAYALTPGYYAISASLFQAVYLVAMGPWNALYEKLYQEARHNIETFERAASHRGQQRDLIRQRPPGFWAREYVRYDHLRFARLCAWLRHKGDPPHQVGHALFVWKLDAAALQAALLGPPVELAEPSTRLLRLEAQADPRSAASD